MVVYTCTRCGYSCKNKSYYKKHLLRKVICEPNITNVPISELYDDMYGKGRYAIDINMHAKKNVTNYAELRSNTLENTLGKNVEKKFTLDYAENTLDYAGSEKTRNLPFMCKFCNKIFKQKRYLKDHYSRTKCGLIKDAQNVTYINESNNNIPVETEINANKDLVIASQSAVIKELRSQIETLLKEKGNTYSYTQNIVVHPFGKESINHISGSYVKELIDRGPIHCIPNLLKEIHFNDYHRENSNIKIPNKKNQLAQIFNGTSWEYTDKKTTINNMTSKAYSIINRHYDSGSNVYMDTFKTNYENEEKEVVKKITKDTEIMILNNQGNIPGNIREDIQEDICDGSIEDRQEETRDDTEETINLVVNTVS